MVRLVRVEGGTLQVEDVDVVDGTPLLDIKPYLPEFDCREVESRGWLEANADKAGHLRSDGRFGVDGPSDPPDWRKIEPPDSVSAPASGPPSPVAARA